MVQNIPDTKRKIEFIFTVMESFLSYWLNIVITLYTAIPKDHLLCDRHKPTFDVLLLSLKILWCINSMILYTSFLRWNSFSCIQDSFKLLIDVDIPLWLQLWLLNYRKRGKQFKLHWPKGHYKQFIQDLQFLY